MTVNKQGNALSPHHSISQKVSALSSLFSILALLYTYPSREQAVIIASQEFFESCLNLMRAAFIDPEKFLKAQATFEDTEKSTDRNGSEYFRAEYTRLFLSHPLQIRLNGSAWVKSRTPLSKAKGESFAVGHEYRQLGLRHKKETKDSSNHLVSELDYMFYVTDAEAKAWGEGDIASACEWRELGNCFLKAHLSDLALGVSSSIQRLSRNTLMVLFAVLLEAVITCDFYVSERD